MNKHYKKPNPFVGLEKFVSWDHCGIIRGKALEEKDYLKLTEKEQKQCFPFEGFEIIDVTMDKPFNKLIPAERKLVYEESFDDGITKGTKRFFKKIIFKFITTTININ